ncbi:unnamed protein product, partial [Schistosoma curassoni]|uniref:Endo/exonuclease/phosphatase domain-containing protein n=1 Tax=Schistosoma curassoni TaxID=6186 RepID=A0A183KWQ4_9TREM
MGRHGLGQRNENGERFSNLCAFNKLVIGGTIFPLKRIHKATWNSPDHTTEDQIDHICINKKFRRTMEDVRTRRGADVASDYHLVVANLKLKLNKNWTDRVVTLRLNIIQCYAPTNDSNDDIKDQFYERLQSIIEKCPRKDLTILMGDLNAKVGIDNTGYEDIMGRHGL